MKKLFSKEHTNSYITETLVIKSKAEEDEKTEVKNFNTLIDDELKDENENELADKKENGLASCKKKSNFI